MSNEELFFWDPTGEKITNTSFTVEQLAITEKVQNYKNHPYEILLILSACILLPILAILALVFIHIFDIRIFFVSFIPIVLYYQYLVHLQDELILFLLCEKNRWAYKPEKDDSHIKKLLAMYREIFNQGYDQTVEDQIWGKISQNEKLDFWRSTFIYKTGSGRSTRTYTKAIFMLRLDSRITENFSLVHAGLFAKFEEDIKTESEEFNHTFRIVHHDKTPTAKTQIMKTLSPSVQVRLITFAKEYNVENIAFSDTVMIIVFKDEIWKPQFTNFIKKVDIDQRDESVFYTTLTDMMQIPAEMLQFIQ